MTPASSQRTDRDIDLVLLTGAGASCRFGVNDTNLPLMADWSEALVTRLREASPAYLEATGLEAGQEAELFEARLGRFLQSVEAFRLIGTLLDPLASIEGHDSPSMDPDGWTRWHESATHRFEEIIKVVYGSLYEQFAAPSIDEGLVQQVYGNLFLALGVADRAKRWVYATTNYDLIGELAIHRNGGRPDVGEIAFDPAVADRPLTVEGLLDGMPRHVPVLHLHGRVGWFMRGGAAHSSPTADYNPSRGVPVIMLPDLQKSYADVPVITELWDQFEQALRRARCVFVLGHALNDKGLVRALQTNVSPLERIIVTFLESEKSRGDAADDGAQTLRERVKDELPGARACPIRFEANRALPTEDLQHFVGQAQGISDDHLAS
jgi:hypothetical protein